MLGLSLSFAVKRWPEPEEWARLTADDMGIKSIQFTFDLIDPLWPGREKNKLAKDVKEICKNRGIVIHSAFAGLSYYTYNGLMHPSPEARKISKQWWMQAADLAMELETKIIGGPLGGLSCASARDAVKTERLYKEQIEFLYSLCEHGKKNGLTEIILEPTPLVREFPHTIDQVLTMSKELSDTVIPVRFLLDVGHVLYRPLHGRSIGMMDWFEQLGECIGALHIQNTDFQSDSHWGWPDDRGLFDVAEFGKQMRQCGLDKVPVFLEVFYPFEMSDEDVLGSIKSSIAHCASSL